MADEDDLDTTEMPTLPGVPIPGHAGPVQVRASGLSHRGKVRANNEDHYLIARVGRSMETLFTNLPEGEIPSRFDETGTVMMVADGMGGARAGEVASRMAISTLVNVLLDVPDWIMKLDDAAADRIMRRAVSYYRQVDSALAERALAEPELSGMGTTMTLAYSLAGDVFIAHVGDSRVYLFRQGSLKQLTRDQTQAQMLVEAGVMAREEVATHRLRHVLTNVLGCGAGQIDVEVQRMKLTPGDRLLLCSDGLTEMVPDATIAEALGRVTQPELACRTLVDLALERGGRDNVTVVVARFEAEPAS